MIPDTTLPPFPFIFITSDIVIRKVEQTTPSLHIYVIAALRGETTGIDSGFDGVLFTRMAWVRWTGIREETKRDPRYTGRVSGILSLVALRCIVVIWMVDASFVFYLSPTVVFLLQLFYTWSSDSGMSLNGGMMGSLFGFFWYEGGGKSASL